MAETWRNIADIPALANAIDLFRHEKLAGRRPPGANDTDNLDSSHQLAREAERTLWEELPLCAIAEAHKNKAEYLKDQPIGADETEQRTRTEEAYVEYLKYLQLYPDKNNKDYKATFELVRYLEKEMSVPTVLAEVRIFGQIIFKSAELHQKPEMGIFLPAKDRTVLPEPVVPAAVHSSSWKFFFLGALTVAIGSFFVNTGSLLEENNRESDDERPTCKRVWA
ncbi:hypothetical protein DFH08DRAFT_816160 [Mycena albidolilacea]|uniref:Uncharacterized protein n=1 Tax=Mycena albidolilacea TaxID=1033008 RepID=A0AAD7EIF7_9AGAR|nr:hypothetical protein DFH08DRAFT_816160 [Mycena albidolilacea]